MNHIRAGVTGTALVAAAATVAALVPGASAVSPPQSSSHVSSRAAASTQQASVQIVAGQGTIDSRVLGEFGRRGTVRGTFDAQRFIVKQRETYAVGILHATLRRGDGSLVGRANRQITIPVRNARVGAASAAAFGESAVAGGSCQILDLVLGPLDLNLLGLKVHLNRVVLNIEAAPGAGALLGNLLCAVAGLLDGTGLLEQLRLANVLNRILSILRT